MWLLLLQRCDVSFSLRPHSFFLPSLCTLLVPKSSLFLTFDSSLSLDRVPICHRIVRSVLGLDHICVCLSSLSKFSPYVIDPESSCSMSYVVVVLEVVVPIRRVASSSGGFILCCSFVPCVQSEPLSSCCSVSRVLVTRVGHLADASWCV